MGGDAVAGRHHGTPPGARDRSPDACRGPEPARVGQRPLGDTCGWHERGFQKMLYWVRGQIVFRVAGGGTGLGPGGNMVLLRFTAPGGFLPAWTARDHDVR
jgi:hypothetical protein